MIALTHVPSPKLQAGERMHVPHVEIDHALAEIQHADYCRALAACGADVVTLDVNTDYPDSTFLEDTAVILDEVAVLASMGAASRRKEVLGVEPILSRYRDVIRIEPPATLEGGDVLRIGRRLLVGHSRRTSAAGIESLAAIARRFNYQIESIGVHGCLHLKTACTALPDGRLLVQPAWIDLSDMRSKALAVPADEPWAANIALIDNQVLASSAFPQTAAMLAGLGFAPQTVDLSEFAKAEGGVTCLSLLIH
jgi:dimethylargininase